jgi:hypothetical protein
VLDRVVSASSRSPALRVPGEPLGTVRLGRGGHHRRSTFDPRGGGRGSRPDVEEVSQKVADGELRAIRDRRVGLRIPASALAEGMKPTSEEVAS